MIRAVRLHGASQMRLEEAPEPPAPERGQVLLRSRAVGICGSDLHTFQDGRLGTTAIKSPAILGHEFGGVIEAVGDDALDGNRQPLQPGTPVAVDPAVPCGQCEICEKGHPNLCPNVRFFGLWPIDGAMCDRMLVPARNCFPLPPGTDFGEAALLETLGVGIHAVDLAQLRVGDSAAIFGAGPIGLCILQVARLAGANPIFVTDKFDWRLKLAERFGAIPIHCDREDPVTEVLRATNGRGVDVAIEAAWADHSVQQAVEIARVGGRIVLVGIPGGEDKLVLTHSIARRKGLTLRMARRMKHVYPRSIDLYQRKLVDLKSLISHRFPLEQAADAFEMNLRYEPPVVKIIIDL